MAQKKIFDHNEESNNQSALVENIQEQTDLISNEPQHQQIKLILVASPEAVRSAILHFHLIGEAEVSDWSRTIPSPSNPEEVMSILYRKIAVQ